ncbi:hypothetical protein JYU15_02100 [bacterium AH-315-I18]|nr:hypothetical protein [Phycisphaeraceae bacterium]MBN4061208.1 hypothetical protein [bacterium AH-315-I18]
MNDDFYDSTSESPTYRDCRWQQMLPFTSEPSVDISTRLMNEKLQQVHSSLLERATAGRLTFRGDEIISTTANRRHRENAVQMIHQEIQKLEAQAQLKESHVQYWAPPVASPIRGASAKSQYDVDILDYQAVPH